MEQQGYNLFELLNNNPKRKTYSAALYLRFSRDDGQANDSSSIQTQKLMLEKYCKDYGYKVYDIYIDDGYTGLNFDRPDFQRLMRDIDNRNVNLVITKDLSRLGRDYIQTGDYIENYFADNNVRYIAINDGVDTARADSNDFMPFRNIINNMYSRDISRKIKSALRQRAISGMFIKGNAPYGYKNTKENKHQLVIDEEPAEVVKLIFRLFLEGKNRGQITRILKDSRIKIPCAYKAERGFKGMAARLRGKTEEWSYKWRLSTIRNILINRMYVGDMVNHRFEVPNYRSKRVVAIPKDEYIIVENTHEAIISREDFNETQKLLALVHRPPKVAKDNIFQGKIICACGTALVMGRHKIKSVDNSVRPVSYYRCMNRYRNPDKCTKYNYIYFDDICEQVSKSLKRVIRLANDDGAVFELVQKKAAKQSDRETILAEKSKIDNRLSILTSMVRRLYEDSVSGLLDSENYQNLLSGYQKEQKALKEHLEVLDEKNGKTDNNKENYNKLNAIVAEYADFTELSKEMIYKLIERIELSYPKKEDGKINQEINIFYKFINEAL